MSLHDYICLKWYLHFGILIDEYWNKYNTSRVCTANIRKSITTLVNIRNIMQLLACKHRKQTNLPIIWPIFTSHTHLSKVDDYYALLVFYIDVLVRIDSIPRCHYDKCSVAKRNSIDRPGILHVNRDAGTSVVQKKKEESEMVFAVNLLFCISLWASHCIDEA